MPHAMTAPEAPAQVPVLELTDVSVVKNGVRALDGLSLVIEQGQHTAIVGPNGAGKSTLVNLLALQDRALATGGERPHVRVFGRATWDVFELRSRLGIVSAELHQRFVHGNNEGAIRGEDAVLSGFLASQGLLRYGVISEAMRERARRALARLGAGALAGKRLHEMSNGEARRVLLARALVTDPWALLLDEPTTGLDLVARHQFMEHVRDVARAGTTLILVTHHVDEIVPEIAQVVLLRQGRVACAGPKAAALTDSHLTHAFDAPIAVRHADGWYAAWLA